MVGAGAVQWARDVSEVTEVEADRSVCGLNAVRWPSQRWPETQPERAGFLALMFIDLFQSAFLTKGRSPFHPVAGGQDPDFSKAFALVYKPCIW